MRHWILCDNVKGNNAQLMLIWHFVFEKPYYLHYFIPSLSAPCELRRLSSLPSGIQPASCETLRIQWFPPKQPPLYISAGMGHSKRFMFHSVKIGVRLRDLHGQWCWGSEGFTFCHVNPRDELPATLTSPFLCVLHTWVKTVLLMLSVGWSLGARMKAHHWGMRHTRCPFRTEGCRKPVFYTKIFVIVPGAQSYNSFPYNPTCLSYRWMGPGSLVIV